MGAFLLISAADISGIAFGVTLAWDPSPSTVAGYRLYRGGASGVYTNSVSLGRVTTATVTNLTPGATYFFAVTAYDSNNLESDFSNQISYTAPLQSGSPSVTLTGPANGTTYNAPAVINCTANVVANGHTITSVRFYYGTTLLGQDTTAPYSLTWSNVSAGSYLVTAQVVYDAGSTAASSASTVTVVNGSGTTHLDFAYADRASLLAAGWDFLGRTASGATRNTELTSGVVVDYDQLAHPGVIRVPADAGDLWTTTNNTHNTLFRNLPSNWTSIRLKLAFAPTQNYQEASLLAYQDDDNYVQVTREYNSGNKITLAREGGGSPVNVQSASVSATSNLHLRLDRSGPTTYSAYYSLDGTTWAALGSATQTLNNPRLAIVMGASPGGYPKADLAWVEILSPVTTTPPTVALTAPASGASYTAPAIIDLAASVTANGNTISSVRFYNGTTLLGQDTTAPYSLTWSDVSAGSYSVTAQAVYGTGSTVSSAPAALTVNSAPAGGTLPPPWQSADIGSAGATGSAVATNGVYTVRGAGTMSGTADRLRLVYQPLTADGEIRARLAEPESVTNGIAGVMIRESLTTGSRYAFMGLTGNGMYRWQRRSITGGDTRATNSGSATPPNAWVRLVRNSNTITGYKSPNGSNWTQVASRTIGMATNIYVGLAVASGHTNTLNTARFNSVSVVP